MVPTPHNVLDLVQEISRAGRDGKDSVAMVLYNSYNLRTGEPEVKPVVTRKSLQFKQIRNGRY